MKTAEKISETLCVGARLTGALMSVHDWSIFDKHWEVEEFSVFPSWSVFVAQKSDVWAKRWKFSSSAGCGGRKRDWWRSWGSRTQWTQLTWGTRVGSRTPWRECWLSQLTLRRNRSLTPGTRTTGPRWHSSWQSNEIWLHLFFEVSMLEVHRTGNFSSGRTSGQDKIKPDTDRTGNYPQL